MFWHKKEILKEVPKPQKQISTNTLTIHTDYGDVGWTLSPVTLKDGKMLPWRDFYTWYFGRPKSKFYVMRHDKGETMIKRKHIRSFEVKIGTKFVDA